ncbi:MAG: PilZ domain-containing protein [Sphingomicrobium sp.]
MPMLGHFEEQPQQDRRRSVRRALKLGVAPEGVDGVEQVTILDLSLTGALLETSIAMLVGAAFEFELPHAGKVEAEVIWNSGEYYGCQFRLPISPAALSAAQLQGQPRQTGLPDPLAELRELNEEVERLAWKMDTALRRLTKKSD